MFGYGYGRTTYHNESAYDRESGKRVRSSFPNAMTAHVWAQRTQTFGKSGNGNLYFIGDSLFSYGSHFLVGFLMEDRGEVIALLTTESYGTATGGHKWDAWRAVQHLRTLDVPSLTELRDALPILADNSPAVIRRDYGGIRHRVRQWLALPEVTSGNREARELIARRAGLPATAVTAGEREAERAKAKSKAERAKREKETREADAKRLAGLSDSDFAALFPHDGSRSWEPGESKPYDVIEAERFKSRLFQAQKAARARGWNRIARTLGERRKQFQAHFAGRNDRIAQTWRDDRAREIRRWRNGEGSRPNAWQFEAFPAIKRAIELAEGNEQRERYARIFAEWQAGERSRPSPDHWPKGSPEREAIESDIAAERERFESMYREWLHDNSNERPPSRHFLGGTYRPSGRHKCRDGVERFEFESGWTPEDRADYAAAFPFGNAYTLLKESEDREERERRAAIEAERQAEREREQAERFRKEQETRERWLAGESVSFRGSCPQGGALMRIVGDRLETSHGADVPLDHAIRAFRAVRACRDRGTTWQRNGKQIRVGHFQVDRIESDGSFTAGCHQFFWPEIERVARLAGVLEEESE